MISLEGGGGGGGLKKTMASSFLRSASPIAKKRPEHQFPLWYCEAL